MEATAPEERSAPTPMCVGPLDAMGNTRVRTALSGPPELPGTLIPLQHSQFERELTNHPDKARITRLLRGIQQGVDIGYMGARKPMDNLLSSRTHPHIYHHHQTPEGSLCWSHLGPLPGPFSSSTVLLRPRGRTQERQQVAHDTPPHGAYGGQHQ